MAQAIQHTKFIQQAYRRRQHNAARRPARGLATGFTLSTILWLTALVIWLSMSL